MDDLNRRLNEYLGIQKGGLLSNEFIRTAREANASKSIDLYNRLRPYTHLEKEKLDELVRVIEILEEFDIPVSAYTFFRDPGWRLAKTAWLAFKITLNPNSEVPYIPPDKLKHAARRVASAYQKLLKELYEVAALLEVAATVWGFRSCVSQAIDQWQHYLFYARKHEDQAKRIQLAEKHLEQLCIISSE